MNIEPQKDYLYKNNKYVKGDVVLSQSFMLQRRIKKILINLIFVLSTLITLFIGYKLLNPSVLVDGKSYSLQKDINNLEINDNVIYSKENDYLKINMF